MVQTIVDEGALLPTDENNLCYTCRACVLVLGSNVAYMYMHAYKAQTCQMHTHTHIQKLLYILNQNGYFIICANLNDAILAAIPITISILYGNEMYNLLLTCPLELIADSKLFHAQRLLWRLNYWKIICVLCSKLSRRRSGVEWEETWRRVWGWTENFLPTKFSNVLFRKEFLF